MPKLDVRLVNSSQGDKWSVQDWGVLGLAPQGSFFNYLNSVYDEDEEISLAIKYNLIDAKASNDDLEYETQVYINPEEKAHYKEEEKVGDYQINADENNFWYLEGGLNMVDSEFKYSNEQICLDSYTNELFGVVEGDVWCNRVRKIVCKKLYKGNCKVYEANLNKAPVIELNLSNTTISFTHEDYLYFDKEGLQCRIGDPCTARYQGSCAKNTQLVLGKLFMSKYVPIFTVHKDNSQAQLTLVKKFKSPKLRKTVWLVLGIIAIALSVCGLIFICWKKHKESRTQTHSDYIAA